jgi:S-adenosylmethionine decarboxylase
MVTPEGRAMEGLKRDDFVGRHLIVDASTYTRRNLSSTDTVFALFEALNRNLDMTAVLPPIVCRYPFANDELAAFCDDIEAELAAKAKDALSLTPVRLMRDFLRRRQLEESGVTGVSIWAESHAAIHTWDEDNYYAFDAFSCRDFRPRDALRLLLTHFDIEMLNCVNLFRYQRSIPRVSKFEVNASWEVLVDGQVVADLDAVDFNEICPGGPTVEPMPPANARAVASPVVPARRPGAAATARDPGAAATARSGGPRDARNNRRRAAGARDRRAAP